MANLMTFTAELLRSGKYSDLTLICNGQSFRVHKAIVCSQSPVLTAALNGQFKEAKTNTIEVDFDVEVLECMLDYMYTMDYKQEPVRPAESVQSAQQAQQDQQARPASPEGSQQEVKSQPTAEPKKKPAVPTNTNIWVYHVRVNGIADYYNVKSLATLSIARLSALLEGNWSTRGFCELLQEAGTLTGDKDLHQLLAKTAASHAPELLGDDCFSGGKIANNIAAEVLKALSGYVTELRSRIESSKAEVRAERNKNHFIEKNLKELVAVSSRARSCCKRECKKVFGCVIQPPSENPEKRYLIRCTDCGCRHMFDFQRDMPTLAPPPFQK